MTDKHLDNTDFAPTTTPSSVKGEVSGAFLLGLVESFYHLHVLPQGGLKLSSADIDPQQWYPYSMLMETLHSIEQKFPAETSKNLLFQAGVYFLRIWYENGPGKTMIHSTMDWLYANTRSGGYNTVVRGGSRNEIGWCDLISMDEEKGMAVHENVTPLRSDYVRGAFYGGCMIFDDVDFVDVEITHEPYPPNPLFTKTIITTRFRKKPKGQCLDLEARIGNLAPGNEPRLSPAEVNRLVWRYKHLSLVNQKNTAYYNDINSILADAITTSQQIAQDLEKAKIAAETANKAKSIFLANMSHELRTPLNAILGFSQIMFRDADTPMAHKEKLDIVIKSGDHLLCIINDVLDLTKIESGKATLEPRDIDVVDLLHDLVAMMQYRAEAKGLKLMVDQTSSFPRFVTVDPGKLRQVIINLLGNAIKFTDHGQISLKLWTKSISHQTNSRYDHELCFDISDTGPGIAPENLERIFKPFEQLENGRHSEGTGLGLTISREFARLMGGDITVTSAVGKGSTFRFTVGYEPVAAGSLPQLERPRIISAIHGAEDCRILVIEDQIENRQLLRQLLTPYQFQFREADNGQSGIDAAREWAPHLILIDRRMPILDGLEATRKIRQLSLRPSPKIIAVTAHAFEDEKQEMIDAGCDDLLPKPFKEDDFFVLLEKHLPVTLVSLPPDAPSFNHPAHPPSFPQEMLISIPAELLHNLSSAITTLNPEVIAAAIQPITLHNPQLGNRFAELAENYAYSAILQVLGSHCFSTKIET